MPTSPYYAKGKRVPGVTTVLGGCQDCGALIGWAGNVTRDAAVQYLESTIGATPPCEPTVEGLLQYIIDNGPRAVSKLACDIGTIAHEMVECSLTNTPFDKSKYPPEQLEKAINAYRAFKAWAQGQREDAVYSTEHKLVSEKFYYGGTIDLVRSVDGLLVIQDWKTSKALRSSYAHQVAAYRQLVVENFPNEEVANYADVVRFDKETGDFEHKHISCLKADFRVFLHKRAVYEYNKQIASQIPEVFVNINQELI